VRPAARFPVLFFTATLCVSAFLAIVALWVWSRAQTAFDYMVVGTFGATAAIAVLFVFLVKRRML
jgi:hypothetical protein